MHRIESGEGIAGTSPQTRSNPQHPSPVSLPTPRSPISTLDHPSPPCVPRREGRSRTSCPEAGILYLHMQASPFEQAARGIPCMCAALRRTTRAVSRLYDDRISRSGIRGTQYTLLRILDSAGPLRQNDVAEIMHADAATLSRTLRPLERDGLLTSEVGEDKRERLWSITPEGRKRVRAALSHWEKAQRTLREAFTESEWKTLRTLLDKAAAVA